MAGPPSRDGSPEWPVVRRLFVALPAGVDPSTASGPPDLVDSSPYEVERDLVAAAVPSRRLELFTGRTLARAALGAIGVAPTAIGRRPDRSPDWPAGVVGSITHSTGLCSVVVARPSDGSVLGIGLDAEVDAVLDGAVIDRVLTPAERLRLGVRTKPDAVVVFSIKEAIFKAINPATGAWLEFDDVEIEFGRDDELGPGERDGGPWSVTAWAAPIAGVEPPDVGGRWCRFGPWVICGAVATS